MSSTHLVFVHALSPLHAGTGQGSGVIDLPIAREKATNIPYLPGSSLKGPLRDRCEHEKGKDLANRIFGKAETSDDSDPSNYQGYAGSVQFSDQRLLLLPVRSLYGTFAWVTSPYILNRFARDVADTNSNFTIQPLGNEQDRQNCRVAKREVMSQEQTKNKVTENIVYLEDLDLKASEHTTVTSWARWLGLHLFPDPNPTDISKKTIYWRDMFTKRLCVVHDDVFSFLLNTATEITARIRLSNETKTVTKGALWYEESLPAESVLSGLMLVAPTKASGRTVQEATEALNKLSGTAIQLGGKATVGRGICRVTIG